MDSKITFPGFVGRSLVQFGVITHILGGTLGRSSSGSI